MVSFRKHPRYRPYLKWIQDSINRESRGSWEPPLQHLESADTGHFRRDGTFDKSDFSLDSINVDFSVIPDATINKCGYGSDKDFHISVDGGTAVPLGVAGVNVNAGAEVTLRSQKSNTCVMHLITATENKIDSVTHLLEQIQNLIATSPDKWWLDRYIVVSRIECTEGFVAFAVGREREIKLTMKAKATIAHIKDLGSASLSPNMGSRSSDDWQYEFGDVVLKATPLFKTVGVNRQLWKYLIPTRRIRGVLVDASGKPWHSDRPPPNLRHLSEDQRCYQPGAEGVLTASQILEMPLDELFGPFDDDYDYPRISVDNVKLLWDSMDGWARGHLPSRSHAESQAESVSAQ